MFLWQTPRGLKTFRMTAEKAEITSVLAKNQGLYNGFLSAGLIWGLLAPAEMSRPIETFFLSCVIIAGAYGGATVGRSILFIQAAPAALALACVWLGF